MNLPLIFTKVATAAKNAAGTSWLIAKKHAPEIMIGTGILGFGATVYETVNATNKTNDILKAKEEDLNNLDDDFRTMPETYTRSDYEHDIHVVNRSYRIQLIKAWLPVATLGAASVASVLGGYRIINGRYVATAAAYKVLEAQVDRYRGNVIERFGKDVDWQLMHDIKAEELEAAKAEREENRKIAEENKGRKFRKKPKKTQYEDIYTCWFDSYSERWQRYWTAEQVLHYLQTKENELNDLLNIRGHVFVNEINDALGLERTAAGQVAGYLRGSRIEIISNIPPEELRRILAINRNDDICVKIHLHPDGIIYKLIDKNMRLPNEGLSNIEKMKMLEYDD